MTCSFPMAASLHELAPYYQSHFDLRQAFAQDPTRFERLSLQAPHVLADLSKLHWGPEVLEALLQQAEAVGLEAERDALLAGAPVNLTEGRPVLHPALRCQAVGQALPVSTQQWPADLTAGLADMLQLAEALRQRDDVDDVVHIGIGGSGLGPETVLQALHGFRDCRQRLHIVTNLDGHDLSEALEGLDPARTVFVVVSKSWSTADTLRNAASALAWSRATLAEAASQRFIAVSARPDLARADGMGTVLAMPEGIGGRFSVWSAVGLVLAVALGAEGFKAMLRGAADMDHHFATAPLASNLPVWLGALDVWHCSHLRVPSRAVVPYHHGLRRLPAYLQQLEMESNGKQVGRDGQRLAYPTVHCVWGQPGSDGQHAFFQWLHQGTHRAVLEMVVVARATHALPHHQSTLVANALAQAQALMVGGAAGPGELAGHQDFPGNRPSLMLLLDTLTPASLGALLALYEHRTFVSGVLWGVNPFDQWGVEIGKRLARRLEPLLTAVQPEPLAMQALDASTAGLIRWLRERSASA
jgi:glucose-6-phosphate isomerase